MRYLHVTTEPPKHMKKKLMELKAEIDHSIIISGNYNTSLSITDTTTRHKVNNETDPSNIMNQLDLKDFCRTLHMKREECVFFACTHGTFL